MSKGYVYILSNPSMPGLVKIGKTTRDVNQRADELHQTGVPTPFKIEHVVMSPDCDALEQHVHLSLSDKRVSTSREFFEIDTLGAKRLLEQCLMEQVEEWLGEFIPDHEVIECDMVVEQGHIYWLAEETGSHPFEVASALGFITTEQFAPVLLDYRARMAARKAKRDREDAEANVLQ